MKLLKLLPLLLLASAAVLSDAEAFTCSSTAFDTAAGTTCAPAPQRTSATVLTLPTCTSSIKGSMYFVTDALLPAFLANVTGSGAVTVGVMCNGSNWIIQ